MIVASTSGLDWAMFFVTAALVVVTSWYVKLTRDVAKAGQDAAAAATKAATHSGELVELERARRDLESIAERSARVEAELVHHDAGLRLEITNFGPAVAFDVVIDLHPPAQGERAPTRHGAFPVRRLGVYKSDRSYVEAHRDRALIFPATLQWTDGNGSQHLSIELREPGA